jgi:spermidine synthase
MLLDGIPALSKPGILAPYSKDICDPIKLVDRIL